jgi:hypothetical protein
MLSCVRSILLKVIEVKDCVDVPYPKLFCLLPVGVVGIASRFNSPWGFKFRINHSARRQKKLW